MLRETLRSASLFALLVVAACGSDSGRQPDRDTGMPPTDTESDTDDTDGSVTDTASGDTDASETDGSGEPACAEAAVACSDDALAVLECSDGAWQSTPCMTASGTLCEDGECVPPWTWGAPSFGTCPDHPRDTGTTLAAKADAYDDIARRLHVHPDLGWAMDVRLATIDVECPEGVTGPCREPVAGADDATWEDVAEWQSGENDGLWNGLYIASQAFRYAVTGSEDALEMLRLLMRAEERRMAITGVPGLFTRQMIPPGIDGLACPEDPLDYVPDVEKDDNKWVVVGDGGCVEVYDPGAEAFVATEHCGLDEFTGWCWLDNVSQDEYAGHMMALAAVWRLVDDEEIRATAQRLIEAVGVHMVEQELTFVDWDGRVTEHGILYAMSLVDSPGFLAAQAMAWLRLAIDATGREDLRAFYDDCLLQRSDAGRCMGWPLEDGKPYTEHLPTMLLYVGADGCTTNFNRLSMVFANLWILLEYERDPELRATIQQVLRDDVFNDASSRAIANHGNPWFNFMWAASKALGPGTDGPALDEVEAGICALREFPDDKVRRANDVSAYERYCEARLGGDATEAPIPVADRCTSTFLWWRSPYDLRPCADDPAHIAMPADFLLAYWMGRYYGFIPSDI